MIQFYRLFLPIAITAAAAGVVACEPKPAPRSTTKPPASAAASASSSSSSAGSSLPPDKIEYDESALDLFKEQKVTGSFVLYDEESGITKIVGKEDAYVRWQPCSTFKIPNTVIGLETGVISDVRFSLKWDKKKRNVEDWNRDHDLTSAMRFSVVWFYQEVARRIGESKMKSWVEKLDYGNHNVTGAIDSFWLDDGSLRISSPEQVRFLRRLLHDDLPAARKENLIIVRRIIPTEHVGPLILHAKTGRCTDKKDSIGWYVGWLDHADAPRHVFALHLRGNGSSEAELERLVPIRHDLTIALLRRFKAL